MPSCSSNTSSRAQAKASQMSFPACEVLTVFAAWDDKLVFLGIGALPADALGFV